MHAISTIPSSSSLALPSSVTATTTNNIIISNKYGIGGSLNIGNINSKAPHSSLDYPLSPLPHYATSLWTLHILFSVPEVSIDSRFMLRAMPAMMMTRMRTTTTTAMMMMTMRRRQRNVRELGMLSMSTRTCQYKSNTAYVNSCVL